MTRKPQVISDLSILEHQTQDPFLSEELAELDALLEAPIRNIKKPFPFGKIVLSAISTLLLLGFGLWTERLIRTLYQDYSILGWFALIVALIAIVALVALLFREFLALRRLASVEHIRQSAQKAVTFDDAKEAKQAVDALLSFTLHSSLSQSGRKTMQSVSSDIIDGKALIHLAESEILRPLDREARQLILGAAKRVSIVTAVSPRALVDLGYVFYESSRLIRNLAALYGCRPGRFGFFRILRRVLSHLAVTGSIAIGDGLVQQLIGQGLAARLSARLGEGVVNGLMTTRIGIAAMDALRPFPFDGEKRPGISDFTGDLMGFNKSAKE